MLRDPTQATIAPSGSLYEPVTDDDRAIAARAASRRLRLSGDNAQLRARYDEIMQWVNPPWDDQSKRMDPRPGTASAARGGRSKIHADWVSGTVLRWAVLTAGVPPAPRVPARYVGAPLPPMPDDDPQRIDHERQMYEIERAEATDQAAQMEAQTLEWMEAADFHRTLLWACWAKEAFGKAILKDGWDDVERLPTMELLENPSQCYYAHSSRYGRRHLAWFIVADQMLPEEAEYRYGITLPRSEKGAVDFARWTGSIPDTSDMDARAEQSEAADQYLWVEESWEYDRSDETPIVRFAFIVGGRVLKKREWPWKRLPFHVLENSHIPTWMHGRSVAEVVIPLNEAYDDLLDRQHTIIEFESGPRYMGINFGLSSESTLELPEPGNILPLREGEEIRQIDTRVDLWPAQVHGDELRQAFYWATMLTPIALGMSPNAQTSGRALSAEWRAVLIGLAERLVNLTPETRDIWSNWWDYAEAYWPKAREVAQGYRRFNVVWEPLDIRDDSERITSIIALYQADLLDPESAIEATGRENVEEILARIRQYLTDPVWNPLRYQQMLVLKQLALSIEQQEMQNAAMRQQAASGQQPSQGGSPTPEELAQQGEVTAAQAAQGPAGPVGESMNQPGAAPAGLPLEAGLLSRTPLEGGSGNQIQLSLGGGGGTPVPTQGITPR